MSLHGSAERVADSEDFGLAGHLAAIELMHREALAQLDTLVQPWAHLWAARSDVQASETSGPAGETSRTEELPVEGRPLMCGAHAEAA